MVGLESVVGCSVDWGVGVSGEGVSVVGLVVALGGGVCEDESEELYRVVLGRMDCSVWGCWRELRSHGVGRARRPRERKRTSILNRQSNWPGKFNCPDETAVCVEEG